MADNRMWLVHKPTGQAILLAKLFGEPKWVMFHEPETYDKFFGDMMLYQSNGYDKADDYKGDGIGDDVFEIRYEIGEPHEGNIKFWLNNKRLEDEV